MEIRKSKISILYILTEVLVITDFDSQLNNLKKGLDRQIKGNPAVIEMAFLYFNPPLFNIEGFYKDKTIQYLTEDENLKIAGEILERLFYKQSEIEDAKKWLKNNLGIFMNLKLLDSFPDFGLAINRKDSKTIRHSALLSRINVIFDKKMLEIIFNKRIEVIDQSGARLEDSVKQKILTELDKKTTVGKAIRIRDITSDGDHTKMGRSLVEIGLLHNYIPITYKTYEDYYSSIIPRLQRMVSTYQPDSRPTKLSEILFGSKTKYDPLDRIVEVIKSYPGSTIPFSKLVCEVSLEPEEGRSAEEAIGHFIYENQGRLKLYRNHISAISSINRTRGDFIRDGVVSKSFILKYYPNFGDLSLTGLVWFIIKDTWLFQHVVIGSIITFLAFAKVYYKRRS